MPPKKKKAKKAKGPKVPKGPPVPPLHELWSLETLHAQFEEKCKEIEQLKGEKRELESTINTLQTDHQSVYEKFEEEFKSQNTKINDLVEAASSSEALRLSSETSNQKKMQELASFAQSAQHTVTKISAEWKAKLVLLREAETAVVRNAQLEIENSKLNRNIIALKEELKKREKQLYVVSKAGMDSSTLDLLENYDFRQQQSNQEEGGEEGDGDENIVGERKERDVSVALAPLILEAMKQFPTTAEINNSGLKILSSLTQTKLDTVLFHKFSGLNISLASIRGTKNKESLLAGVKLLWKCSTLNEDSFNYIQKEGGIPMTLYIMRLNPHSHNRRLIYNCIRLLNFLCGEIDMSDFSTYDSMFKDFDEESSNAEIKSLRSGQLEDLFPRVGKKRELEKKLTEQTKKLLESPKIKKKKEVVLPGIKAKKKAAISPSKRRSILMLGEEEEEEEKGGEKKALMASSSLPLISEASGSAPSPDLTGPPAHEIALPKFVPTDVSSEEVARNNPPNTDTLMIVKSLFKILSFCLQKAKEEDAHKEEAKKSRESKSRHFSILSKNPNMSSPGMVGMREKGLTKVSSMPTMTGQGTSAFSHLQRGKRSDEESSDSDSYIEEGDEDEESDDEEVGEWDGGGSVETAGGKGKGRRRTKGRENMGKSKEGVAPNEFRNQSFKKTARDVLVNLVLSIDSSSSPSISSVLMYKSVQKLLVSSFGALLSDGDAVSACCMLLRAGLKEKANERLKQVKFLIQEGLSESVQEMQRVWEQEQTAQGGKVGQEVNSMVEELGTQFERTLTVNNNANSM
ncbi:hypothetical protein TrVE_jg7011 [Triparma verrucosa]|uniref:Uncharacterized protein n=1 Tax=Triparma verrucosa TaxID=1606542 RepID=A0A9W7CGA5_9STRA|nr:hypothetical protein TrVE_jg7011 [Triparma verrucosa]